MILAFFVIGLLFAWLSGVMCTSSAAYLGGTTTTTGILVHLGCAVTLGLSIWTIALAFKEYRDRVLSAITHESLTVRSVEHLSLPGLTLVGHIPVSTLRERTSFGTREYPEITFSVDGYYQWKEGDTVALAIYRNRGDIVGYHLIETEL